MSEFQIASGINKQEILKSVRVAVTADDKIGRLQAEIKKLQDEYKESLRFLNGAIVSGVAQVPVTGIGTFMVGRASTVTGSLVQGGVIVERVNKF